MYFKKNPSGSIPEISRKTFAAMASFASMHLRSGVFPAVFLMMLCANSIFPEKTSGETQKKPPSAAQEKKPEKSAGSGGNSNETGAGGNSIAAGNSVQELIDKINERHLSLKSSESKADARRHAAKNSSWTYPDPEIMVSRSKGDGEETALYPDPGYQSSKITATEVRILQPIPFPGKLSMEAGSRKSDAKVSRIEFFIERNRLSADTLNALIELSRIRQEILLTEDFHRKIELLHRIVSSRYGTGSGNLSSITSVKLKSNDYRDKIMLLKGEYEAAKISLQYYAEDEDPDFSDAELKKYFASLRKKIPDSEDLEKNSLEIALLKELQEKTNYDKKRSRLNFTPDIGIFAGYRKENMEKGFMQYGGGVQKMYTVGVNIKVPLWSTLAGVSDYREKKENEQSADFALANETRKLNYRFGASEKMLSVHESRLRLLNDTLIPQAALTLNSANLAWETKKIEFSTLLDAYDALYSEHISRIEVDKKIYEQILEQAYMQNVILGGNHL